MIEAIAKIVEAAQEVAVSVEECKISISVIEDMKNLISEISEGVSKSDELSDFKKINGVPETAETQLDARSTYFKEGHSYETDDRGRIYKKDGEVIPGVEYTSNGGKYRVDAGGNVETLKEGYQSTYKERYDQTPTEGDRGSWTGDRAESCYKPNVETEKGAKAAEKLSEYGLEGIEYRDALPNFDACAEESVEIDMTENRPSNFENADIECAKKWNEEGKGGRSDWSARDVANYRHDHNMTWHECADRKTCQMISRDIHDYFGHSGGVFECKKIVEKSIGGGFDAWYKDLEQRF